MVEDRQVGTSRRHRCRDFIGLATANEQSGIGTLTRAAEHGTDLGAGRAREFFELAPITFVVTAGRRTAAGGMDVEVNQDRLLTRRRSIKLIE